MADLEFEIAKRRREPITFSIGEDSEGEDHTYTFSPPKSALMLMPVIDPQADAHQGIELTKATFDWLGKGLSEEDNDRILARIRDEDDDLDVDTLSKIVEGLSDKVAGRPTS